LIIVQTPLRVSLFGGGTDFPAFFKETGGCVLTTAIDKYVFVAIKQRFDDCIRVGYTQTEMVSRVDEVRHALIREAMRMTGLTHGIEITTMGDIPSAGSGLGSSSTVTVGALHAMHAHQGALVPAECLAREACEIEIDILRKPIGIQDQYIAAYGGFRFLEFNPDGQVTTERLALPPETQRALDQNLLLFYTGITRSSDTILEEQENNMSAKKAVLQRLKELAHSARNELENTDPDGLGALLDEGWHLKKQLASKISNPEIDLLYQRAKAGGALGGKLTGAGGGGFLLVYCPIERQAGLRRALADLQELPFRSEHDGSKVIFNYRR
jgi:D-glycero-alpha-D-manno-heptose-7-phosphate kinase